MLSPAMSPSRQPPGFKEDKQAPQPGKRTCGIAYQSRAAPPLALWPSWVGLL